MIVLHPSTKEQLTQFMANPAHAVLLTGPDGVGKTAVAEHLVATLLQVAQEKLANYPHFLTIRPEATGNISIEAIRTLQKFLQLKTIGTNPLRRVVLIEHAQGLTTEAQNAYLKLLEEPPADTVLILTANSPRTLLPTIMSRVQHIAVHIPAEEQLQGLLAASPKDDTSKRQAYFLSGGLPGLLQALISGNEEHPLSASVNQAKELLQKQPFERLAAVDALSKQKEAATGVVAALERIAATGITQAAARQDTERMKRWHGIRKQATYAQEALARSANTKLTLTNLFLHL